MGAQVRPQGAHHSSVSDPRARVSSVSFQSADEARPPTCIDLFAGAGGLSEGLLQAGLDVVASVELHPQPGLTHAFNHPATQILVGDIRDLDYETLDQAIARRGTDQVDVVVGGPPCQGFSSAGKKASTDPRNSLFRSFVDVIEHLRPRMFMMENVPGFKSRYGGRVYAEAQEAFQSLGYSFDDTVLTAAEFGVPQRRRRFVMVGWLPDEVDGFEWPVPTSLGFGTQAELFSQDTMPTPTAGDALEDLAFLQPGFEATRYSCSPDSVFAKERRSDNELLFNHLASRHRARAVEMFSKIGVGGSIRDLPASERTRKQTMVRLDPDQISNTVVSLPDDLLHYAHHRILTVRECARLQTFDDDFVFIGKRTSGFVERRVDVPQYTQVGNAVPPLLGRAIGAALVASLGAEQQDLRDIEVRRDRQQLVAGSSGYAGYTLTSESASTIGLLTVRGEPIALPICDEDEPVIDQADLIEWKTGRNPRRGQWAPGVQSKDKPSWVAAT